jgi:hypothetical protein
MTLGRLISGHGQRSGCKLSSSRLLRMNQFLARTSRSIRLLLVGGTSACLISCASVGAGVGVGVPIFPGVSLGVGVGSGGVNLGVGAGVGPVGVGVGVDQGGRVTGSAGVGASTPIGGSNARVGVGVGTGTVLHDPNAADEGTPRN